MGYSSKWPMALRFGSHNYGGLELKNLATTALIKKIHGLQNLLYKPKSANAVHLVIAWFQHASGLTTPILEPPHAASKYVNSIWLSNFINLLSTHQVQMILKIKFTPLPQRYNDNALMDDITQLISSEVTLKRLNACRMFLQVTWTSDIANVKGDKILESALKGEKSIHQISKVQWPLQQRPNEQTWKIWRKTIRQVYCCNNNNLLHRKYKLQQWLSSPKSRTTEHKYQYSPLSEEVYVKGRDAIIQHFAAKTNRNKVAIIEDTEDYCSQFPDDCIPISKLQDNTFQINFSHKIVNTKKEIHNSLSSYFMTRSPSIRHLIKNYTLSPSHSLLELITNKTPLLISTDGSKTTTKCGGSWVIATTKKEIIASGPIPIYGQQKDIHSYRTEVYASLAVLLFLRHYAEYYSVTVQNKVVAICDNKGYVNKLKYSLDNPKSIAPIHKMNESEALILILQNVPNDFSITHIAAHQDDNTNYGDLSVNAQLNVDADYLATKNITLPLNQHLESQPFALYMNEKYLHANISKDIRARSH